MTQLKPVVASCASCQTSPKSNDTRQTHKLHALLAMSFPAQPCPAKPLTADPEAEIILQMDTEDFNALL